LQKRLPRLCYDHFPILLDCGGVHWGSRPFKFKNMWLKAEGFVDRARLWWESYCFQGSPGFIFSQKLKALKNDLKRWNEQEFGNVEYRKKMLMEELCALDSLEEQRGLTPEENVRKCGVIRDLENSILQEEISWRQKSRVLWLKEGDKCTKFFLRVANSNKRSNSIESLSVNGSTSSDQQVIRDHVALFYKSLFAEPFSWRPRMDNLALDTLDVGEASSLELPFEEREVLEVVNVNLAEISFTVKGLNRDKAPGLDGFTLGGIPGLPRLLGCDQV